MNSLQSKSSMNVNHVLVTDGSGYWSNTQTEVNITKLELIADPELGFGELCVYFDENTWDVDSDGLIYTDKLFLHELKHFLVGLRLAGDDVGYSEQGMQGDNYVSLDVGPDFINSWNSSLFVSRG